MSLEEETPPVRIQVGGNSTIPPMDIPSVAASDQVVSAHPAALVAPLQAEVVPPPGTASKRSATETPKLTPAEEGRERLNPDDFILRDTEECLYELLLKLASKDIKDSMQGRTPVNGSDRCGYGTSMTAHFERLRRASQNVLREKATYEQKILLAESSSKLRYRGKCDSSTPETKSTLRTGWEVATQLLKQIRNQSPEMFTLALEIIRKNLLCSRPLSFSDNAQVSKSALEAIDNFCGFLSATAGAHPSLSISAEIVSVLSELSIARASLPILLSAICWCLQAPSQANINLARPLAALASISEKQLYGVGLPMGELYACGQNSYGELSIGDDVERHALAKSQHSGSHIVQVTGGNEVVAAVTGDGTLLTCGLNKSGQCGQGHFSERVITLTPVVGFGDQRVVKAIAGNGSEHMFAITSEGKLYSWGFNDRGQLGQGSATTKLSTPKPIEALRHKTILGGALSYHHSAVFTESGELFTFGMNDCGQLGIDSTQHQDLPQLVTLLGGQQVQGAGCGLYHTVVCTVRGEVYSFGKNDYGQLGLGHNKHVKVPCVVHLPNNDKAISVSCGYYHTIIVCDSGSVYSFGRNDYGQLGIGNKVNQNAPQKVQLMNDNITAAACGCYHTLLLGGTSKVFVFGRNNKGQLGNRSTMDAPAPIPLTLRESIAKRKILGVAAGFYSSYVTVEHIGENSQTQPLRTLCGRIDVDPYGEVEGLSNFGSVHASGISLTSGKWYYEVEVVTSGLIQIGWADGYFQASSDQGEGVGDHPHSWAYDGNRQKRWNQGATSYGDRWVNGDVIGCYLDLESGDMAFSRNGTSLGVAFGNIRCDPEDLRSGLWPAISLERNQLIRINLGLRPFRYCSLNVGFRSVLEAFAQPSSVATVEPVEASGDVSPLGDIRGYRSVTVGDDVFVVGGDLRGNDDQFNPTTQTWVFRQRLGLWQPWVPLPEPVRHHQLVAVEDYLVVIGGESSDDSSSRHMKIWRCDTSAQSLQEASWEVIKTRGSADNTVPKGRAHHAVAVITVKPVAQIFLYGGRCTMDCFLDDSWSISMNDWTWCQLPNPSAPSPGPRMSSGATAVGEWVYIFGGQTPTMAARADLWRYNTFEQVWQLCYSDLGIRRGNEALAASHMAIPAARARHSLISDSANLWLFGGTDLSRQPLNDLWRYSLLSERWSRVNLSMRSAPSQVQAVEFSFKGTLMASLGPPCLLKGDSTEASQGYVAQATQLSVFNGQLWRLQGIKRKVKNKVTGSGASFVVDTSADMSSQSVLSYYAIYLNAPTMISGDYEAALAATTSSAQGVSALHGGICMLAHLDRLACSSLLPSSTDQPVQPSNCDYRTLCIFPSSDTFECLLRMISGLMERLVGQTGHHLSQGQKQESGLDLKVIYPLQATLRILKVNLFEVHRASVPLDTCGLALRGKETLCGRLRQVLFEVIEKVSSLITAKNKGTGENALPLELVLEEAISAVHVGISVLFPTVTERTLLLVDQVRSYMRTFDTKSQTTLQPSANTSHILLPLLLPSYVSNAELFAIVSSLTGPGGNDCLENLTALTDLLLDLVITDYRMIWELHLVNSAEELLRNVEASIPAQCLQLLHQAAIVCATTHHNEGGDGEAIASSFALSFAAKALQYSSQLLTFMLESLKPFCEDIGKAYSTPRPRLTSALEFLRSTLCCNLLSSILQSLPHFAVKVSVRTGSLMEELWVHTERLLTLLKDLHSLHPTDFVEDATKEKEQKTDSKLPSRSLPQSWVVVSKRLSAVIFPGPAKQPIYELTSVYCALWLHLQSTRCSLQVPRGYMTSNCGVGGAWESNNGRMVGVVLNGDIKAVLRVDVLVVGVFSSSALGTNNDCLTAADVPYDSVDFSYSSLVLSSHLTPVSTRKGMTNSMDLRTENQGQPSRPEGQLQPTSAYNSERSSLSINTQLVCLSSALGWDNRLPLSDNAGYAADLRNNGTHRVVTFTSTSDISPVLWRDELVKTLSWIGAQYGHGLTRTALPSVLEVKHKNWTDLELLRGGLIIDDSTSSKVVMDGPRLPLEQLILLEKDGKYLMDRLKDAMEQGVGSLEAHLRPSTPRLRRVDSMDRLLERNGSLRMVDKAVRATLAALLRHSYWPYLHPLMDVANGAPSERLLQTYSFALQIRHWIVQEQQKLAAGKSQVELIDRSEDTKNKNFQLYEEVCDGVVKRASLLLQLSPAFISKLLGAQAPSLPGPALKESAVSGTFTEEMEYYDERIRSQVISFLKAANSSGPTRLQQGPLSLQEHLNQTTLFTDEIKNVLQIQSERGRGRVRGLEIFTKALELTEYVPACRLHILPLLGSSFRELSDGTEHKPTTGRSRISLQPTAKLSFFQDVELAPNAVRDMIRQAFFTIMGKLVKDVSGRMKTMYGSLVTSTDPNFRTAVVTDFKALAQDCLLCLDVCAMPFSAEDSEDIDRSGLTSLLAETVEWSGWLPLLTGVDSSPKTPSSRSKQDTPIGVCPLILPIVSHTYFKPFCCSESVAVEHGGGACPSQGDKGQELAGYNECLAVLADWDIKGRSVTRSPSKSVTLKTGGVDQSREASALTYVLSPGDISVRKPQTVLSTQSLFQGRWYWEVAESSGTNVADLQDSTRLGIGSYKVDVYEAFGKGCYGIRQGYVIVDGVNIPNSNVKWTANQSLGFLLDCDERTLMVFAGATIMATIPLNSRATSERLSNLQSGYVSDGPEPYFPAISVDTGRVKVEFPPNVPNAVSSLADKRQEQLKAFSGQSVGLLPSQYAISDLFWDANLKGGSVIVFEDGISVMFLEDVSESETSSSIVRTYKPIEGKVYFEVSLLSSAAESSLSLLFGVVSGEQSAWKPEMNSFVEVPLHSCALRPPTLGVLVDTECMLLTVFYDGRVFAAQPINKVTQRAKDKIPLFAAVSCSYAGSVIRANFHPTNVPESVERTCLLPLTVRLEDYQNTEFNHEVYGDSLQMAIVSADGGEFSGEYSCSNILQDDDSVYSTTAGTNANIVLRHANDTPFCLTSVIVRGPGAGYTAPVGHVAVFVTSDVPDEKALAQYDNLLPEEFLSLPYPTDDSNVLRDTNQPVLFFCLNGGGGTAAMRSLRRPLIGRYVTIKLIRPQEGANIDVGYVGCRGYYDLKQGPAYSTALHAGAACSECFITNIEGVRYRSVSGTQDCSLCPTCYDNERGNLHEKFVPLVSSEEMALTSSLTLGTRAEWIASVKEYQKAHYSTKHTVRNKPSPGESNDTPNSADPGGSQIGMRPDLNCSRLAMPTTIYGCGQNNYGELSLGHSNSTNKVEHIAVLDGKVVVQVAGGNETLAALTKDGELYTAGLNKSGQCGQGNFEERITMARPVKALEGKLVTFVAAGNGCEHMLAITEDGAVFSWGYNDKGQLGHGTTATKVHTPKLIDSLRGVRVVRGAVSYHHSLVISDTGDVYTFGMNECGQLGLDNSANQTYPQAVGALKGKKIVAGSCGLYHSVVVSEDGEMFAFGKNDYGQLGLGHNKNVKNPTPVNLGFDLVEDGVVDVSCGYYHTVLVTGRGKVFAFGRNDYGQLGIGSKQHANTPQQVLLGGSTRAKQVSCGCYHTLLLTDDRMVFAFGRNNKGQLGAGSRALAAAELPLQIPGTRFGSHDGVAIQVAAGFYTSYVVIGLRGSGLRENHNSTTPLSNSIYHGEPLLNASMAQVCQNVKALNIPTSEREMGRLAAPQLELLRVRAGVWILYRLILCRLLGCKQYVVGAAMSTMRGQDDLTNTARSLLEATLEEFNKSPSEMPRVYNGSHEWLPPKAEQWDSASWQGKALSDSCMGLFQFCASDCIPTPVASSTLANWGVMTAKGLHKEQTLYMLLSIIERNTKALDFMAKDARLVSQLIQGIVSVSTSTAVLSLRISSKLFPRLSVNLISSAIPMSLRNARVRQPVEQILHIHSGEIDQVFPDIYSILFFIIGYSLTSKECGAFFEAAAQTIRSSTTLLAEADSSLTTGRFCLRVASDGILASESIAAIRLLNMSPEWKRAFTNCLQRAVTLIPHFPHIVGEVSHLCSTAAMCGADIRYIRASLAVRGREADLNTGLPQGCGPQQKKSPDATRKPEAAHTPLPHAAYEVADQGNGSALPAKAFSLKANPEDEICDLTIKNAKTSEASTAETDLEPANHPSSTKSLLQELMAARETLCSHPSGIQALRNFYHMLGVIAVTGGFTEQLRPGSTVSIQEAVPAKHLIGTVLRLDSNEKEAEVELRENSGTVKRYAISMLRAAERVSPTTEMFDLDPQAFQSFFGLLREQPYLSAKHQHKKSGASPEFLCMFSNLSRQMQWRTAKALSTLLSVRVGCDEDLLTKEALDAIIQAVSSEGGNEIRRWWKKLGFENVKGVEAGAILLQARWHAVKERQQRKEAIQAAEADLHLQQSLVLGKLLTSKSPSELPLAATEKKASAKGNVEVPTKAVTVNAVKNDRKATTGHSDGHSHQPKDSRPPLILTNFGSDSDATVVPVWGLLSVIPSGLEEEVNVGVSLVELRQSFVILGRQLGSCDVVINDRSISSKHFSLRHLPGDRSVDGSWNSRYELRDTSKNGTIVDGIRIHNTSVALHPGARLSLILSRGGLITFEFQLPNNQSVLSQRASIASASNQGHLAAAPSDVVSPRGLTVNNEVTETARNASFQEARATSVENNRPLPAPGTVTSRNEEIPTSLSRRLSTQRQRIGLQSLTIDGQSAVEVPSLMSPNPAIDSPRVESLLSPSHLQMTGDAPLSPTSGAKEILESTGQASSLLATAGQRPRRLSSFFPSERDVFSSAPSSSAGSTGNRNAVRRKTIDLKSGSYDDSESQAKIAQLLEKATSSIGFTIPKDWCAQALSVTNGNYGEALAWLKVTHRDLQEEAVRDRRQKAATMLSHLLGLSQELCMEGLMMSEDCLLSSVAWLARRLERNNDQYAKLRDAHLNDIQRLSISQADNPDSTSHWESSRDPRILWTEESTEADDIRSSPSYHIFESSDVGSAFLQWNVCLPNLDVKPASTSIHADVGLDNMPLSQLEAEEVLVSSALLATFGRQLLGRVFRAYASASNQSERPISGTGSTFLYNQGSKSVLRRLLQPWSNPGSICTNPWPQVRYADEEILEQYEKFLVASALRHRSTQREDFAERGVPLSPSFPNGPYERLEDPAKALFELLVLHLKEEASATSLEGSGCAGQALFVETLQNLCAAGIQYFSKQCAKAHLQHPVLLSSGVECIFVNSYIHMATLPAANPMREHRWRWFNDQIKIGAHGLEFIRDKGVQKPTMTTIWRPSVNQPGQWFAPEEWFPLEDIILTTEDMAQPPSSPSVLIRDDGSGILTVPREYKCIPLTTGFSDKPGESAQQYMLWIPVAPDGYVPLGCIHVTKTGTQPPPLNSLRCLKASLAEVLMPSACVWSSYVQYAHCQVDPTSQGLSLASQESTAPLTGVAYDALSLWVSAEGQSSPSFVSCRKVGDNGVTASLPTFSLTFSEEDQMLCGESATVGAIRLIKVLLDVEEQVSTCDTASKTIFHPSLCDALLSVSTKAFEVAEHDQNRIDLIRTLTVLLRRTRTNICKASIVAFRGEILRQYKLQKDRMMMSAVLQGLIELLLVVHENEQLTTAYLPEVDPLGSGKQMRLPYRANWSPDLRSCQREPDCTQGLRTSPLRETNVSRAKEALVSEWLPSQLVTPPERPGGIIRCKTTKTINVGLVSQSKPAATLLYYELQITAVEKSSKIEGLIVGYGPRMAAVESVVMGETAHTYGYDVGDCKLLTTTPRAEMCPLPDGMPMATVGDTIGCGLRLDTGEIFYSLNGNLVGILFMSVLNPENLCPVISLQRGTTVKLNFGMGSSSGTVDGFMLDLCGPDWNNLFEGIDWFNSAYEVMQIINALSVPTYLGQGDDVETLIPRRLPEEFLLAADTFLSTIAADECKHIESGHPYALSRLEGKVLVPLATALRIRLAPQSETHAAHCLQILQGLSASQDDARSVGSELRAFTGLCGGQEVTVPGNSFTWRFPSPNHFQCRFDRGRKGPFVRLEAGDMRAGLTRDKGWQACLGMARFETGIHVWEIRIVSVTSSANIFVGVGRKDIRLDSYLGKDSKGWGWIGNKALWHNGTKHRGAYGEKFKSGDLVRMTLDLVQGTLSFALNGKDFGVAFGPGGVGPKLEGALYPGFALYNQKDCIELVSGHRVEDGSTASGSSSESISLNDSESLGDTELLAELEIPPHRKTLAMELSALGFSLDSCIFALRNSDDDPTRAVEFILTNADTIETMVAEEREELSRRMEVAKARTQMRVSRDQAAAGNQKNSQDLLLTNKWGIAFSVIPEFSHTARRILASIHRSSLEAMQRLQAQFTIEQDQAIVALVNGMCANRLPGAVDLDPLRLSPEELVASLTTLVSNYSALAKFSLEEIGARFVVIRNFNRRLQQVLPMVDFTVGDRWSLLGSGIKRLKTLIFHDVKVSWWETILKDREAPASSRPEVEIDRHRPHNLRESETRDTISQGDMYGSTIFSQCFNQLHHLQPSLLRGSDRSFKCQFLGEYGDDFGGLFRETMAELSTELQSKFLPIFIETPNTRQGLGRNQGAFVPNPAAAGDPAIISMLEFVGKLMGMAIRSKTPLDLNLPAMVWKPLVGDVLLEDDIEEIDEGSFKLVNTIGSLEDSGMTEENFLDAIDTMFTAISATGQEVELFPGGAEMRVTWQNKDDYAILLRAFRMTEFRASCEAIARGLATIVPFPLLSMFEHDELRMMVCGRPTVDIELLKRRTVYGEGCQATDAHIQLFWQALERFTDEQKSLFLRFVWGRSRLPAHASDFTQDFKISGMPKSAPNPDAYLPVAHTCFFSIDLPMYTSLNVMTDRLLYAIKHCQAIDADNTTQAQRAAQSGGGWLGAGPNGIIEGSGVSALASPGQPLTPTADGGGTTPTEATAPIEAGRAFANDLSSMVESLVNSRLHSPSRQTGEMDDHGGVTF